MKRIVLILAVAAMVGLAGCGALTGDGGGESTPSSGVALEDDSTGGTNVTQTLTVSVDEAASGEEWTEIGATYPRENFTVSGAQHDAIGLGVDTDADGDVERTFNESHVSGVNNNAYSFDVTLDTDYTLETGDVLVVEYPDVDNPSSPGDYTVEALINGNRTVNVTATVE